jgi:arylsulfatase A-like enzyme
MDLSVLSPRAALMRVASFGLFGLLAGAFLFVVEFVDRFVALRSSISGLGDGVVLFQLLGITIFGMGLVGVLIGVVATLFEALRQGLAVLALRVRPSLPNVLVEVLSLLVSALIVAWLLQYVSGLFPGGLELSIERVLKKVDDRLAPIPWVLAHWRGLYSLAIFVVTLAVMWADVWIFREKTRWSTVVAAIIVVGGLAAFAICYQFDSRSFFARYEYTIHYPLISGYALMSILLAGFAARAVSSMSWWRAFRRPQIVASAVLWGVGIYFAVFGFLAMDLNQNVKAMVWNRSVVARRCFEIGRVLVDRDRDGYSPIFGGGDSDDRNGKVHPFAVEIPGNGIDDDCIGGDLSLEDAALGPKRAAPGEYIPVSETYAWDPKYTPPKAIDVANPLQTWPWSPERRNVFIISIDCLRADHMSLYGYGRQTTPNIDRYAQSGLVFENAIPHGTNTGHSFAAMLRSASMEGIFDANIPTLTQVLKSAGYHTSFINARRLDEWLPPRRWHRYRPTMIDNFDVLHLQGEREWTADQLVDSVTRYVDAGSEYRGFVVGPRGPEFMWVHFMDVHMPREGHPEYGFGNRPVDVYDAEIKYTDAAVGRLLDFLKDKGLLENSIVFITADHGEEFMEHGMVDHSNKPYASNSHVPLIVLAPGIEARRVAELVGMFDIAPTALSNVGVSVPDVYRGIDLISTAKQPVFPQRVLVSETPRNGIETSFFAWAYIDWPYKYMYDSKQYTQELYNLVDDPDEQVNLVERDSERAARMRQALGAWLGRETAAPETPRAAR